MSWLTRKSHPSGGGSRGTRRALTILPIEFGFRSTRGGVESRRQYFRFRRYTFERRWRNAEIPIEIRYPTLVYLQRIESLIADERKHRDITPPNWIANRKRTLVSSSKYVYLTTHPYQR